MNGGFPRRENALPYSSWVRKMGALLLLLLSDATVDTKQLHPRLTPLFIYIFGTKISVVHPPTFAIETLSTSPTTSSTKARAGLSTPPLTNQRELSSVQRFPCPHQSLNGQYAPTFRRSGTPECFVSSGVSGYRELEPGDILSTASSPLLHAPSESLGIMTLQTTSQQSRPHPH